MENTQQVLEEFESLWISWVNFLDSRSLWISWVNFLDSRPWPDSSCEPSPDYVRGVEVCTLQLREMIDRVRKDLGDD